MGKLWSVATLALAILLGLVTWCVCLADPAADLKQGSDLIAAKQYDEAIKLLGSVKSADSSLAPQALEMIGDCYRLKEDFGRAAESYEAVLATYTVTGDQSKRIRRWLIKCHIRHQDWGEVEKEIDAVASESPAYASGWWYYALGKRHLRNGDFGKGISTLCKAIESCKDNPEAAFLKDAQKTLVKCHIGARDWEKSIQLVTRLSGKYPEEAAYWHECLGAVYQGECKYSDAIEELKQAIEPESAVEARKLLGQCYQVSRSPAAAASLIWDIVIKYPADGPYLPTIVGQLYQGMHGYDKDSYEKAIAAFRYVVANYPDARWQVWDAFFYMAECMYPLNRSDEVLSAIREFYAKHPDRPVDFAIAYGKVLWLCAKKPVDAVQVLEKTEAEHPKDPVIHEIQRLLAGAYVDCGKTSAAAEELTKMVANASSSEKPSLVDWKANVYFSGKEYSEAAETFKEALKLEATSPDYRAKATYYLALCYNESGLANVARTYMHQTVENYPNTDYAKKASRMLISWGE